MNPQKRLFNSAVYIILGGLIVFICLCAFSVVILASADGNGGDSSSPVVAYVMCTEFVKDRLKSPSTAQFPDYDEIKELTFGVDSYRILGYVDSQNSYGAMLRIYYKCEINYAGNEHWNLVSLVFE